MNLPVDYLERVYAGVLGKLSSVRPGCEWLDRIASPLLVAATLLHRDPAGGVYSFEAHGDGRLLLLGRFTLLFRGSAPPAPR